MSAVPISLADLIQLSRYAQNAGTETQYIALSLEWAAQAQHEINRLTAELKQVKATWIEPKPVTPPSLAQGSRLSWPFMQFEDSEAKVGYPIPETPT
jgi:hypothetical protein